MNPIYDKLGDLAHRLIDKFGGDAVIIRASTVENRVTRKIETTETEIRAKAILQNVDDRDENGRRITRTVMKMAVEPKVGDIIRLAGSLYSVTAVTAIKPAGAPLVYEAEVTS